MNRRHFFQSALAAAVAYSLPAPRLYALDQAATQAAGGVAAVKLDGSATVIERAALAELKAGLRGPLMLAGDPGYDEARRVLNRSIDRRPALVVQPTGVADVQSAVSFARERELLVAVKCGGHSFGGKSTCDGGMQIDLSRLRGVRVDPRSRVAWVEGGSLLGEMDHETMSHGLATTAGTVSHTGVGGLTLGGGFGRLARRFGLAIDNLRAVDIVTADGNFLHADADENPDLYWGVRGGGGNFGVVTTMHYRLHELPSVRSGMLVYPFSEARAVLAGCSDIATCAPEDLTVQLGCVFGPDGAPAVIVAPTWCGRPEEGEARVAPFLKVGTLLAGGLDVSAYGASLTAFDAYIVNGQRALMETCWLPTLDSGSIGVFIEAMETAVSPGCAIFTHEFRGAASRVPTAATAFGLRRDHVLVEILAIFAGRSDKLEEHRHRRWGRATLEAFDAMAFPGGYPNLLAAGDVHRATKTYGRNAERLIKAKRHYDPDNVFCSAIPLPVG
jgi:FAD/FMN-containing dehydrogenase